MLPYLLNETIDGVPHARPPLYWDTTLEIRVNLLRINTWMAHYQDRLPTGTYFDEAAVMVPGPFELQAFVTQLLKGGWELFNEASDVVFTNPFGTRYAVRYAFMRHPDVGYRLEIMTRDVDAHNSSGFSPLHAALWSPRGGPIPGTALYPVPHLSFKPVLPEHTSSLGDEDLVSYKRRSYSRAVQHLTDQACLHVMSCQSTYGQFGYFIGNDTQRQVYLKPRVNLRDEGVGDGKGEDVR